MTYRVVVIEDEAVSRRALAKMVADVTWLDCVGEAASCGSAIETINKEKPDIVFLDMRLPGGSGFDVLEASVFVPNIIITTAYRDYAVEAFNLNAVDYLLKPFSQRRFDAAISKLSDRLFDPSGKPASSEAMVFVRSGIKLVPFNVADVEFFSACDDYVVAHCSEGEQLLTTTLSALEQQLDPAHFVRVHRSHIINVRYVRFMRRIGDRRFMLHMRNGAKLLSSRAGTRRLKPFFK